jgi:hypothetical protein
MIKLKQLLENQQQLVYHVTHERNLSAILKQGLQPHSPSLGKDEVDDEGVYFFPDETTLKDAWDAWLEDFFNDNEKIICLTVDITGLQQHVGGDYEIIVTEPVSPKRIVNQEEIA